LHYKIIKTMCTVSKLCTANCEGRCNVVRGKISRRRSEIEILTEILCLARESPRKTALLYRVNLNHALLNKYLGYLIERGLLVKEEDVYSITDKGYEFLTLSRKLQRLLGREGCADTSYDGLRRDNRQVEHESGVPVAQSVKMEELATEKHPLSRKGQESGESK